MTYIKSPAHAQIAAAIIEWAKTRIHLLPNEKPELEATTFWVTLFNTKACGGLIEKPQWSPKLRAEHLRGYFDEHGSNSEKNDFFEAQNQAIERLDQKLLNAATPLNTLFEKIFEEYALTGKNGMRLTDYIDAYPDIFGKVPALRVVYDYLDIAWALAENSKAVSNEEFGRELAYHLREKHNWDMIPGRALYLVKAWANEELKEQFNSRWRQNKKGEAHKTQAKTALVRELFRKSTRGTLFYSEDAQGQGLGHTKRNLPRII